jgi:3-oxoacyl-[acyl-carrier protein] reductase
LSQHGADGRRQPRRDVQAGQQSDDLSGRVAVVTGGAAGLGRAEAIGLARAGATIVVNDIQTALNGSDVVDEIAAAGGEAVAVPGDITEHSTVDALMSAAERHRGLDIVVNNAGITRDKMLFNMTDEEWDAVIAVHLRGHFLLTRNAAAYWRARAKESGGQVYGRLVNTSSEAGLVGPVGQANYGAAKAGIIALTLSAARGLHRYGVCANAICPRARTAMTGELMGPAPDGDDPMSPERVTPLVVSLAGPAGEHINGEVFVVHSDVVAVLAPPTVRQAFHAPAGAWTSDELDATLGKVFTTTPPSAGFVCEDTLPLADATLGENS